MIGMVKYLLNEASELEIVKHLLLCDDNFLPYLSDRVNIIDYAQKIVSKAVRFEAWSEGELVGLVAVYCNDNENSIAYITSVSVLREWMGKGIAGLLIKRCIEYVETSGMKQVSLEVGSNNNHAINLYKKNGFEEEKFKGKIIRMNRYVNNRNNEK